MGRGTGRLLSALANSPAASPLSAGYLAATNSGLRDTPKTGVLNRGLGAGRLTRCLRGLEAPGLPHDFMKRRFAARYHRPDRS
jgi:hypothetical protein